MESHAISCQHHSVTQLLRYLESISSQSAALTDSHVQAGEMYPKGKWGIGTSQRDGKKQDENTFLSRGSICFTLCSLFTQVGMEKLPLSPYTSAAAASICLAKKLNWSNPYKLMPPLGQGHSLSHPSGSFASHFLPGCSELQQCEEWLQENKPTQYLPDFGGFFFPAVTYAVKKKEPRNPS